jgi:hypothetical protein
VKVPVNASFDSVSIRLAGDLTAKWLFEFSETYSLAVIINGKRVMSRPFCFIPMEGPGLMFRMIVGLGVLAGDDLTAKIELMPGKKRLRAERDLQIEACLEWSGKIVLDVL